jgi:hypothetical protein
MYMSSYKKELASIEEALRQFLANRIIDTKQLSIFDTLIKQSAQDQIRILNSSFPLDVQRTMFGAIRNINTSVVAMKERLMKAAEVHENPTTAEEAMDVMKALSDVIRCVDPYLTTGRVIADLQDIDKLSRKLYRKAQALRFSQGQERQLKDAGITEKQVKLFMNKFHSSLAHELGIEEEVQSNLDDSCSC